MGDDALAITNLLYTYAERIDAGDFAGVSALFEHAVVQIRTNIMKGSELGTFLQGRLKQHEAGALCVKHVVTNPIIKIAEDGASAEARSYFTDLQATPLVPLQVIAAGRYYDTFQKVEGNWHFTGRNFMLELRG